MYLVSFIKKFYLRVLIPSNWSTAKLSEESFKLFATLLCVFKILIKLLFDYLTAQKKVFWWSLNVLKCALHTYWYGYTCNKPHRIWEINRISVLAALLNSAVLHRLVVKLFYGFFLKLNKSIEKRWKCQPVCNFTNNIVVEHNLVWLILTLLCSLAFDCVVIAMNVVVSILSKLMQIGIYDYTRLVQGTLKLLEKC